MAAWWRHHKTTPRHGNATGERRWWGLNRARKALESSRDTVASIAFDTGFYDQSHLIKAFRAVYKMTPEKYRQRHMGIPTGRKHP